MPTHLEHFNMANNLIREANNIPHFRFYQSNPINNNYVKLYNTLTPNALRSVGFPTSDVIQ